MIALVKDDGKTAASIIWSHRCSQKLFDLTRHGQNQVVNTDLVLFEKIAEAVPSLVGSVKMYRLTFVMLDSNSCLFIG